jgi:hypothetical protein
MADAINLTVSNARSSTIRVPRGTHRAAIQIEPDATNGWGTAVVTLKWKVDDEEPSKANTVTYQGFTPAVTFSTSTAGQRKVSVTGTTHLILETTTADGTADPDAEYTVIFS